MDWIALPDLQSDAFGLDSQSGMDGFGIGATLILGVEKDEGSAAAEQLRLRLSDW